MEWRHTSWKVVVAIALIVSFHSDPAGAQSHRRRVPPPVSQGYYQTSSGPSSIELRGLRVPVRIETPAHEQILFLAAYWAEMLGAKLRVVSAMDHVHARRSAHYAGLAIDFQGDHLSSLAEWFRKWGYRVYWRVPGHYKHVHVEEIR